MDRVVEANIAWQRDVVFSARADSGHEVIIDGPPELGGTNAGARPMELMLMGLGGCTSVDVVNILQKSRQQLDGCRVEIAAERGVRLPWREVD